MTRGYVPLLLTLSALWGASYLFIKVAVDDGIEPTVMMCARALVAGVLLFGWVALTRGASRTASDLRRSWRQALFLGTFNAALPFWLIAWGEKYIDSGVAGIAQSTVPLFTFLIGLRFLPHERIAPLRWLGVAVGLVGVAVLAGVDPGGGWWAVAGTLAVVLSSVCYACSGIYAQLRVEATPGPVLATGSILVAGVLLLPFAAFQLPNSVPSWEAIASVVALAVLGTTIAQLIFFHMLPLFGARRVVLVTYVVPVFAIAYGAIFLSEPLTVGMLGGLVLILVGVALGSELVRGRRRVRTAEEVL
jgi:drug/metabolite transporter (DMT)-like permease